MSGLLGDNLADGFATDYAGLRCCSARLAIVNADFTRAAAPRVSVVAPCYNEEESLREFWSRTSQACRSVVAASYEIVLVDDGSTDRTWKFIEDIAAIDACVIGVRLHRNHGHQLAATAGLAVCRGDRVMLIDADLQDPPELLGKMMHLMDDGADVVYGQRLSRQGESAFKLATAFSFYWLLSKISSVTIPRNTGDFRLISRRVADMLSMMPERHRFIRGMVSWIGGRQVALPYERQSRFAGQSKYPLSKMIRFAVDAITSFSIVPLRIAVWLGLVVSVMAFILLIYTIVCFFIGRSLPGWASTIVATSLFAGTQLLVMGVFGEYLGRLVEQVKGRPMFMVSVLRRGQDEHVLPVEFSQYTPSLQREILSAFVGAPAAVNVPAPLLEPDRHG